jgi:hypothetical protein
LRSAVVELGGAPRGVVDVPQLVAGVKWAVAVVDGVTKLAQRGAVRVLGGAGATAATSAFIGDAERDATIERFPALIGVTLMANFVALVRRAAIAAGIGFVTQPTEDFAFELERGGLPVAMSVAALPGATTASGAAATAARIVVVVVVAAARKNEYAAGNDEAQAEADRRFHHREPSRCTCGRSCDKWSHATRELA